MGAMCQVGMRHKIVKAFHFGANLRFYGGYPGKRTGLQRIFYNPPQIRQGWQRRKAPIIEGFHRFSQNLTDMIAFFPKPPGNARNGADDLRT
jgi:hypothetical protein